ncbi:ABC transporter permease subunit, partial [Pseudomonas syringae group genomosp. 7]|uniref:ABC transporter permease subunit n=1 Tax=Pseudomonas syringae group genomosp. 7 TaxID=251699 RepID=UPI00376FF8A6
TLGLGAMALSLSLLIAIPLGVLAAVNRDTWVDRLALSFAVLGQAMPSFWFALMLIVVFSVTLIWLPVSGNSTWAHFV